MRILKLILLLNIWVNCSCGFAPGSYPYAEKYRINLSDSSLTQKVNEFKILNPQYSVPKSTGLQDGLSEDRHWYIFYFFIEEKDLILLTYVRSIDSSSSNFGLVSINNGIELGRWMEVNNDLTGIENSSVKKLFEDEILSKIWKD